MKLFDFSKKNVEKNAEKEAKVKENKVEDTQKKSDSVETIVCPNCGKTLLKDVVKKGKYVDSSRQNKKRTYYA